MGDNPSEYYYVGFYIIIGLLALQFVGEYVCGWLAARAMHNYHSLEENTKPLTSHQEIYTKACGFNEKPSKVLTYCCPPNHNFVHTLFGARRYFGIFGIYGCSINVALLLVSGEFFVYKIAHVIIFCFVFGSLVTFHIKMYKVVHVKLYEKRKRSDKLVRQAGTRDVSHRGHIVGDDEATEMELKVSEVATSNKDAAKAEFVLSELPQTYKFTDFSLNLLWFFLIAGATVTYFGMFNKSVYLLYSSFCVFYLVLIFW